LAAVSIDVGAWEGVRLVVMERGGVVDVWSVV
jgi:hypothetical protein